MWDKGPLHTWYSYDVVSGLTTYVLIDCPENVKGRILSSVEDEESCFIHRPLAIDFLISEECAITREILVNTHRNKIFQWVGALYPHIAFLACN